MHSRQTTSEGECGWGDEVADESGSAIDSSSSRNPEEMRVLVNGDCAIMGSVWRLEGRSLEAKATNERINVARFTSPAPVSAER